MIRALLMVALLLAADPCSDQNACDHPPAEVGSGITDAQAAVDPCAGQTEPHVVAWYTQKGVRYPLRCGKRDPAGFGYLHIRYDEAGHGDPVNDATFAAEIQNALDHGAEGFVGGGNWRYTVKYGAAKSACYKGAWGFRVLLAKAPARPDGHPAGIITALYYSQQPDRYP